MTKWGKFFDKKIKEIAREKIILDIGGGSGFTKQLARHKKYFANSYYRSLDIDPKTNPDIVADAHHLPFENESIDAIICKVVLEHVKEPHQVVEEIYRVLKPGGKCFVYLPFLYRYHGFGTSFEDYYRFTQDGVEYLFRKFSKIEICPVRGYFETVAYLLPHQSKFPINILIFSARLLDKILGRYQSKKQASGFNVFLVK